MKIENVRPAIRFADKLEYTAQRSLSKTYDSRLLYIIRGSGKITAKDCEYEIEPGLLVLFSGGTPYSFTPSPSFFAYAVDFDIEKGFVTDTGFLPPVPVRLFDPLKLRGAQCFEDSDFLKTPFVRAVGRSVGEKIGELVREFNAKTRFCVTRAELILAQLLLELADFCEQGKTERTVFSVMEYIDAHYNEPITNASVAAHFGHDACYLGRVVKRHTGLSLHRFLVQRRVDAGVKLLITTDLTLEVIAERVGFCSAAHFSKKCKELRGCSPSHYRKN